MVIISIIIMSIVVSFLPAGYKKGDSLIMTFVNETTNDLLGRITVKKQQLLMINTTILLMMIMKITILLLLIIIMMIILIE